MKKNASWFSPMGVLFHWDFFHSPFSLGSNGRNSSSYSSASFDKGGFEGPTPGEQEKLFLFPLLVYVPAYH
jgi:hypothetical protein